MLFLLLKFKSVSLTRLLTLLVTVLWPLQVWRWNVFWEENRPSRHSSPSRIRLELLYTFVYGRYCEVKKHRRRGPLDDRTHGPATVPVYQQCRMPRRRPSLPAQGQGRCMVPGDVWLIDVLMVCAASRHYATVTTHKSGTLSRQAGPPKLIHVSA